MKLTVAELIRLLDERTPGKRLVLVEAELAGQELAGLSLADIDFSWADFTGARLDGADFTGSSLANARLEHCSLRGTSFIDADLTGTSCRFADFTCADLKGAELYGAVLEHAMLSGVVVDAGTKHYRLHCPERGAFLGYKKCFNDLLVQLLIPADAKRTSATLNSCRCNKAKVLTIKSFDYQQSYDEAVSLVDSSFVYRRGEYVEVTDFNEDRWMDSTTGIHFWLTRQEALAY